MTGDDISLARLREICAVIGVEVLDLVAAAWEGPAPIHELSEEQEAYLAEHRHVADFYFALLVANADVDKVKSDHDLDAYSVLRYLGMLDDLGLVEVMPGGRVKEVAYTPNHRSRFRRRIGTPVEQAFIDKAIESRGAAHRDVRFAILRMTAEHIAELNQTLRDAVYQAGPTSQRDEIGSPESDLVDIGVFTAVAPFHPREVVSIPRIERPAK